MKTIRSTNNAARRAMKPNFRNEVATSRLPQIDHASKTRTRLIPRFVEGILPCGLRLA